MNTLLFNSLTFGLLLGILALVAFLKFASALNKFGYGFGLGVALTAVVWAFGASSAELLFGLVVGIALASAVSHYRSLIEAKIKAECALIIAKLEHKPITVLAPSPTPPAAAEPPPVAAPAPTS